MNSLLVKKGLWQETRLIDAIASISSNLVIIADSHIAPLYGTSFQHRLLNHGLKASLLSFPAGEQSKSREQKQRLEDQLIDLCVDRSYAIIALGGGVTGDLVAFVAATFHRGLPLILIPTSLLAMVDAMIGNKCGINLPSGKNLIGTFYEPTLVAIDPTLLLTLSHSGLQEGCVEMVKHGLIADIGYCSFLEKEVDSMLCYELEALEQAIVVSISIKRAICERDPHDHAERMVLNFGHTVGHAIERASNYTISHGSAVAAGIILESYLSHKLQLLSQRELERIILLLYRLAGSILQQIPTAAVLLGAMQSDKKNREQLPRFVLLEAMGRMHRDGENYCHSISPSTIIHTLEEGCSLLNQVIRHVGSSHPGTFLSHS